MPSILSRLSSLVPDFRPFRTPSARGTVRPRPGQDEKIPTRAGVGRTWFLPYADSTSTDDTPDIRAAMRKMLRDPYVKSAWLSQVLSVLSQPIQVHAPKGKKNRTDQDRADFVRHCLEHAQDGMLGVGTAVLMNHGSDGYTVSEKVWHTEARGKYVNKLTLRALKPKDLDEHGRLIGDEHNNVTGVWSSRTNDTYPITDFVYTRYLHTFDEPMGMAAFRPSYGAYWSRDTVRKLRIIHKEKNLDGLLLGTYEDPADKSPLEAALARARSSTWLSIPAGVRVEMLSKSQAAEGDYKSFDESLREESLVGIALAHLHILQGGVSDARGNTKVHKAVADLGPWLLTYIIQYAINRQIVPDLIDYNYGYSDEYPQVTLGGVSNAEVIELLQVLEGAQRAGFKPSKSYYATELTIQEADPTDPEDLLSPPQAAPPGGGMGGPGGMDLGGMLGGMGGPPGGGGGDPFGGGAPPAGPPAPGGFGAFRECGAKGGYEEFAWDDWMQQAGGKWKSPGGRVLSDAVFQRMKGKGGATPSAARPASPPPPPTVRADSRPVVQGNPTPTHGAARPTEGQQADKLVRMLTSNISRPKSDLEEVAKGMSSWDDATLTRVHHALFGGPMVLDSEERRVPQTVPREQAVKAITAKVQGWGGGPGQTAFIVQPWGGGPAETLTVPTDPPAARANGDRAIALQARLAKAGVKLAAPIMARGLNDGSNGSKWTLTLSSSTSPVMRAAAQHVADQFSRDHGVQTEVVDASAPTVTWQTHRIIPTENGIVTEKVSEEKVTLSPPPPASAKIDLTARAHQFKGQVIGTLKSAAGEEFDVRISPSSNWKGGVPPIQVRGKGETSGKWSNVAYMNPAFTMKHVADQLHGSNLQPGASFTFVGETKPEFVKKEPKPLPPPPPPTPKPAATPPKPSSPFRPLASSGVKLPKVLTASLYAAVKPIQNMRFDVNSLVADTGMWTDMKAAIQLPPAEREKYVGMLRKGGWDPSSKWRMPPMDQVWNPNVDKTKDVPPAKVVGFKAQSAEDTPRGKDAKGATAKVLLAESQDNQAVVDAKYYAAVVNRYPDAEFRLVGRRTRDEKPVVAYSKGQPVALIMPMGSQDTAHQDHAERATGGLFDSFGETGHIETFGWDDWQPRDQYMVSPGGRVLKRDTWERLKSKTPQGGGPTTANGRATPPARAPQPPDRHIQARLDKIRGNPAEALKEVEGDVRAAAAELATNPPDHGEVVDLVAAATPGLDATTQQQLGTRLADATAGGTPEKVKSGFRKLAEWAAGLTGRAAVWAVRGLLTVAKKLLLNTTASLAPPGIGEVPGKVARTFPSVLKYVGVIALSAGLFAASIAAPVLLPVALSIKLGIAAVTLPAGAAWVAWGMRKALKPVGREVIEKWTGYTIPDDMKANPIPPKRKFSEGTGTGAADAPQAGEEIALAGKDGKRAAELMGKSQKLGRDVLARVTEQAVARLLADPEPLDNSVLFTDEELQEIADSLAATTAAADLLGRGRVRRMVAQAEERGAEKFAEGHTADPFDVFAEPLDALPPTDAVSYFRKLIPSIQLTAERYAPLLGRQAFTLAVAADQSLLARVKNIILDQLEAGRRPTAVADIQDELDAAGITPRNPQYAEMVYRTNMNDSYMQGFSAEMADPGVQRTFPVWQYLGIRDGRQGEDHEPHFDRYYHASQPFAEVRGPRVFNCRCSAAPVTKFEWADLQARGARAEGDR